MQGLYWTSRCGYGARRFRLTCLRTSFLVIRLMIESRIPFSQLQAFLVGLALVGGTFHPARPQDEEQNRAGGQVASTSPVEPFLRSPAN